MIALAVALMGCASSGGTNPTATPMPTATPVPTAQPTAAPTAAVQSTALPTAMPTVVADPSLAGKTYEQLSAMGVPLICDVSVPAQGQIPSMQYKMKMSGKNARVTGSIDIAGYGPQAIDTIVTTTMVYSKIPAALKSDCVWFKISIDPSATPSPSQDPTSEFSKPDVKFSCAPTTIADSEFVPVGKACTMDELYGAVPSLPA